MKIIVLVRQIPDPDRPIRIDANGRADVVRWIANPADEVAVDRAVELDAEVIAVSTNETHLLGALARGAARGYLVDAVDDRALAKGLVEIARPEKPDLILTGDGECGPRVAGALDLPQATRVTTFTATDSGLRVVRELPKSTEVLDIDFPAVVTLHSKLNVPALISLHAIVEARNKRIDRVQVDAEQSGDLEAVSVVTRPQRRLGKMFNSVDELVQVLRALSEEVNVEMTDDTTPSRSIRLITSTPAARIRPSLREAHVIVAAGRVVRDGAEEYVNEIANKLGAAVAASGGAVHSGIAPPSLLVGQTGATVAPDLYIAVGISGADQHVGGMQDSRVIVAINRDPHASIFRVADYGLVADLRDVLPELAEKL